MGYSNQKVNDLRIECTRRGLSTNGKKADLIARLEEHDAAGQSGGEKRPHHEDEAAVEQEERQEQDVPHQAAENDTAPAASPAHSQEKKDSTVHQSGAIGEESFTVEALPCTVFVSGLQRPFTEDAFRTFAEEGGERVVAVWMNDPVKDRALLRFGSVNEAEAVRARIDKVTWPRMGRVLQCVAATEAHLDARSGRAQVVETPVSEKKQQQKTETRQKAADEEHKEEKEPQKKKQRAKVTEKSVADIDVDELFQKTNFQPPLYFTTK